MVKKTIFLTLIFAFAAFGNAVFAQDDSSAKAYEAYNNGKAKADAKDYAAALALFAEAIEVGDPEKEYDATIIDAAKKNGAIAAYYVGNDLRKENKNDEALVVYQQGIDYNPDLYYNFTGVALAYAGKDEYANAVKAYLKAAEVAEKTGKGDKAVEIMDYAAKLPGIAWGKKNWDDAIATAEAFLAAKETADAHYYLSQSLKEKGNNQKALTHAMKAAEMYEGEDKDKAFYRLGELHEALGQKAEAVQAYNKAGGKYGDRAQYKVSQLEGGR